MKHFTYDLMVSFSPYLMVSRWSTGLFGHCPPTKWRTKELPNCSKLSMDDVGSLLNHTCAAPLRVVGKEPHNISSSGCYRLKVILKVVIWYSGSFRRSNDSSYGRRNFGGIGHFTTFMVKGQFILLTIPSRFRSASSLIAFLSLIISLLISLRRSKFASSEMFGRRWSSLLRLSPSLSGLVPVLVGERFSLCCNCNLIS